MRGIRLFTMGLVLASVLVGGCGRKDVNRRGEIKLRGERPVQLNRRSAGDLLQKGTASWYGTPFHGRKTSNGETYDMWSLTAAHKTLPFGTWIRVVNTTNNRETRVRINDRGPFIKGRIIDLSRRAAEDIGMVGVGTTKVKLYLAKGPTNSRSHQSEANTQKPTGAGHWTVQVASFREGPRAVALADKLSKTYSDVQIERAKGYFRVRVGQFRSRKDAVFTSGNLREAGLDPWVVWVPKSP